MLYFYYAGFAKLTSLTEARENTLFTFKKLFVTSAKDLYKDLKKVS
jgi:hypothetical protein